MVTKSRKLPPQRRRASSGGGLCAERSPDLEFPWRSIPPVSQCHSSPAVHRETSKVANTGPANSSSSSSRPPAACTVILYCSCQGHSSVINRHLGQSPSFNRQLDQPLFCNSSWHPRRHSSGEKKDQGYKATPTIPAGRWQIRAVPTGPSRGCISHPPPPVLHIPPTAQIPTAQIPNRPTAQPPRGGLACHRRVSCCDKLHRPTSAVQHCSPFLVNPTPTAPRDPTPTDTSTPSRPPQIPSRYRSRSRSGILVLRSRPPSSTCARPGPTDPVAPPRPRTLGARKP